MRDFFGRETRKRAEYFPQLGRQKGRRGPVDCDPIKQERSPITGRCIKIGGRVYKKIHRKKASNANRLTRKASSNWQLYVNSDERSGPDFASVLYVDITKTHMGPHGPAGPETSIVNLGYIPIRIKEPQRLIDMIGKVNAHNRLVTTTPDGWAIAWETPFTKQYWMTDTSDKLRALYMLLIHKLDAPK